MQSQQAFNTRTAPLAAHLDALQQQALDAFEKFMAQHPQYRRAGERAFKLVIYRLYLAGVTEAVRGYYDNYVDFAIGLALYLNPVNIVPNPRAWVNRVLQLSFDTLKNILRPLLNANVFQTGTLLYADLPVDGRDERRNGTNCDMVDNTMSVH